MKIGDDLIKLAASHIDERYVLGTTVPKSNPKWKGPWDCAEFASWCVFQLTGNLFGCRPANGSPDIADAFTGYWAIDAEAQQITLPVGDAAATPGAFILRKPEPGGYGHVVISTGDGGTIEAMSTKDGVKRGKVTGRRWDYGIFIPGIQVQTGSTPLSIKPPGIVFYVKQDRMSGPLVKSVQRALKSQGYTPGPLDGVYGPQTAAAVRAFQIDKKLVPDGEVGPKTARALNVAWP